MPALTRVYLDLSHLGRHVTGIERISIELFEKVRFEGADVRSVRSHGILGMIFVQQVWLPLLALLNPRAIFVFPGFPPSPLFILARNRTLLYVHDLFLITRRQDLSAKARLYMAWPFRLAVTRLKYFLANSATTAGELRRFAPKDAAVALYRPVVANVFGLMPSHSPPKDSAAPLDIISLGTLEPRKNYPAAARIRDTLAKLWPAAVTLGIVGRDGWGRDREALQGRDGVVLHGYLSSSQIKRVVESADLYLCTSHEEGLGLPLLEVQFAGIPVAAPDQPVFREVLGASGLFIDPLDAEGAARTIRDALSDPLWRAKAREAALHNLERWNCAAAADRARAEGLFAGGLETMLKPPAGENGRHPAGTAVLKHR